MGNYIFKSSKDNNNVFMGANSPNNNKYITDIANVKWNVDMSTISISGLDTNLENISSANLSITNMEDYVKTLKWLMQCLYTKLHPGSISLSIERASWSASTFYNFKLDSGMDNPIKIMATLANINGPVVWSYKISGQTTEYPITNTQPLSSDGGFTISYDSNNPNILLLTSVWDTKSTDERNSIFPIPKYSWNGSSVENPSNSSSTTYGLTKLTLGQPTSNTLTGWDKGVTIVGTANGYSNSINIRRYVKRTSTGLSTTANNYKWSFETSNTNVKFCQDDGTELSSSQLENWTKEIYLKNYSTNTVNVTVKCTNTLINNQFSRSVTVAAKQNVTTYKYYLGVVSDANMENQTYINSLINNSTSTTTRLTSITIPSGAPNNDYETLFIYPTSWGTPSLLHVATNTPTTPAPLSDWEITTPNGFNGFYLPSPKSNSGAVYNITWS